MQYCLVENGQIIDGPRDLPTCWRNVSNLPALADEDLAPLGWLPYSSNKPTQPKPLETWSVQRTVSATAVTDTWVLATLTPEQFAEQFSAYKVQKEAEINEAAAEAVRAFTGKPGAFDLLYWYKLLEAQRYSNNLDLPDSAFPMCVTDATAKGISVREAMQAILTAHWATEQEVARIEAIRVPAVVALRAAETVDAALAAIPQEW